MGSRGPARKPTAIAELDGSAKKHPDRYGQSITSEKLDGVPDPPERLSEEAKEYWRQLAPVVHKMGTLCQADLEAFSDLCVAHARRDEAERHLRDGEVLEHEKKGFYRSPWGTVLREVMQVLKDLRAKFGLTASDRANIKTVGWTPGSAGKGNHWDDIDEF